VSQNYLHHGNLPSLLVFFLSMIEYSELNSFKQLVEDKQKSSHLPLSTRFVTIMISCDKARCIPVNLSGVFDRNKKILVKNYRVARSSRACASSALPTIRPLIIECDKEHPSYSRGMQMSPFFCYSTFILGSRRSLLLSWLRFPLRGNES